jgi:hypothetical protein
MEDETADSMIILIIAVSVFLFGIFHIVFSYAFNTPIIEFNNLIESGTITTETRDGFELMMNMWEASPFFFVIGVIVYSFERIKGTDLPANTFFSYMFMMLIGMIVSVYLVYAFGICIDQITQALDSSILVNVSEVWESSSIRHFLVKFIYYFAMSPCFITTLLFCLFPIIKQKENIFWTVEDEGDDAESDVDLALSQFM